MSKVRLAVSPRLLAGASYLEVPSSYEISFSTEKSVLHLCILDVHNSFLYRNVSEKDDYCPREAVNLANLRISPLRGFVDALYSSI